MFENILDYCEQQSQPGRDVDEAWGGTWWRIWLRHCATSRKVAGSIPNGVTGIFHLHNSTGRAMILGSTQSLTEMSTRSITGEGVKGGRCLGLTTLPPSCADCLEMWEPQSTEVLKNCIWRVRENSAIPIKS